MSVAVVGAGIVGLATAYELLERGANVTVYERGAPGAGQSGGESRIFRHAHDDPRLVALAVEARARWRAWEQRFGVELLAPVGSVAVGPAVERRLPLLRDAGVRARMVDAAVRAADPRGAAGAGDARRGRRRDPHPRGGRRAGRRAGGSSGRGRGGRGAAVGRGPGRRRRRAARPGGRMRRARHRDPRRRRRARAAGPGVDPHALRVSGARAARRSPASRTRRPARTATRCPATTATRSGSTAPRPRTPTSPSACPAWSRGRSRRAPAG